MTLPSLIFHCPPVSGPQALERSVPPWPMRNPKSPGLSRPSPGPGWAAPGPTGQSLLRQALLSSLPWALDLYMAGPTPSCLSQETSGKLETLPEGAVAQRGEKKAKDLPQTTLAPAPVPAGALPAPGSYCPLVLLGRGDSPPAPARPWEPGHSWDSAAWKWKSRV